jgi:hypothetical protein
VFFASKIELQDQLQNIFFPHIESKLNGNKTLIISIVFFTRCTKENTLVPIANQYTFLCLKIKNKMNISRMDVF